MMSHPGAARRPATCLACTLPLNLARLHCPVQADKLLSPEFQPVIEQLISYLPPSRQICLYSATFPVRGPGRRSGGRDGLVQVSAVCHLVVNKACQLALQTCVVSCGAANSATKPSCTITAAHLRLPPTCPAPPSHPLTQPLLARSR